MVAKGRYSGYATEPTEPSMTTRPIIAIVSGSGTRAANHATHCGLPQVVKASTSETGRQAGHRGAASRFQAPLDS